MLDFLLEVAELLNKAGIRYMLSGSLAFNLYAVPRSTRDIDIIAEITRQHLDVFIPLLQDRYYFSQHAMEDAIDRKSMFNIIHLNSGYKLDVMVLTDHPYETFKFSRRRIVEVENTKVPVITPEDLVISKLMWIQKLESELQKRDIQQLLLKEGLNMEYIHSWCNQLKLNTYGLF